MSVYQSKMGRGRGNTSSYVSKYQDGADLASGLTGFRTLNPIRLLFVPVIPSYSLFPPLFLSISQLSLPLNVGFSSTTDRLSPRSKECITEHLKLQPERQGQSVFQIYPLILRDMF